MSADHGNQDLLFLLGTQALRTAGRATHFCYSVQRRHPDGTRWLEVGRFPARAVARLAIDALIAQGHGDGADFRVKRVSRPD